MFVPSAEPPPLTSKHFPSLASVPKLYDPASVTDSVTVVAVLSDVDWWSPQPAIIVSTLQQKAIFFMGAPFETCRSILDIESLERGALSSHFEIVTQVAQPMLLPQIA